MKVVELSNKFSQVVGAVALVVLAGCAAAPAVDSAAAREAAVRARSEARWNALVNDRMTEAYGFYSPASRSVLSLEDFIRSMKAGFWKAARVEQVECPVEDACEVQLTIEYVYRGSRIPTPIRESWVRSDGVWWYLKNT